LSSNVIVTSDKPKTETERNPIRWGVPARTRSSSIVTRFFDLFRRLPGVEADDVDLRISDVGEGFDRKRTKRVEAHADENGEGDQHDRPLGDREFREAGEHGSQYLNRARRRAKPRSG